MVFYNNIKPFADYSIVFSLKQNCRVTKKVSQTMDVVQHHAKIAATIFILIYFLNKSHIFHLALLKHLYMEVRVLICCKLNKSWNRKNQQYEKDDYAIRLHNTSIKQFCFRSYLCQLFKNILEKIFATSIVSALAREPESSFGYSLLTLETCCGYRYGPARDVSLRNKIYQSNPTYIRFTAKRVRH